MNQRRRTLLDDHQDLSNIRTLPSGPRMDDDHPRLEGASHIIPLVEDWRLTIANLANVYQTLREASGQPAFPTTSIHSPGNSRTNTCYPQGSRDSEGMIKNQDSVPGLGDLQSDLTYSSQHFGQISPPQGRPSLSHNPYLGEELTCFDEKETVRPGRMVSTNTNSP
jgi:hypothetical protein